MVHGWIIRRFAFILLCYSLSLLRAAAATSSPYQWVSTLLNPIHQSNPIHFRATSTGVELVVPGLNRPFFHVVYVFVAISVSVVFHELGHALAAVHEGASIVGVGILCFFIFPGAFGKSHLFTPHIVCPKSKRSCHNIQTRVLSFDILYKWNTTFM